MTDRHKNLSWLKGARSVIVAMALLGVGVFSASQISPLQAQSESAQTNARTCKDMDIPIRKINSYEDIDRFIEAEIYASYQKNGFVDWECLVRSFESYAEVTSVVVYEDVVGLDGGDVYRFTVDRRDGLWRYFWMVFSMPGGANGVFTSITNQMVDGRVAIINRKGKPIWLIFE